MGSCVSHCSRQDIIHRQSARVTDCGKSSIEIREGTSIDEKDFEAHLSQIVKDYASEIKADDNSSPSDRDGHPATEHFKYEIRALRDQLMRSQVLFSYLLRDTQTAKLQKSTENPYRQDELLEGTRFRNLSNISSGSYASHRSTPMHASFNSLSCPQLPSAAQAEFSIGAQKKDDFSKHLIVEVQEEAEIEPTKNLLRNRTDSFLAAVGDGNTKLAEAAEADEEFRHTTLLAESASADKVDCIYPRKLSILLEEDYEDASGNHFSICTSQPFASRKRPSCNVNTRTDFLCTNEPASAHKHFPVVKRTSPEHIREIYQPRRTFSIVAQAVKKSTVFSEDLPEKLVTRYPPPYTSKLSKYNTYVSSDHIYFKELSSRPKTQIYKWATVAESLPSKSDSFQFFKPANDPNFQTRHLSLEKQESYSSSCDHSLYPESQMSSVTDCSGWMTKSEIDINLHPEPPSYVQSMLTTRWHQSAKNRQETMPIKQITDSVGHKAVMENLSREDKVKTQELKSSIGEEIKDKNVKVAQRSMRRMSADNALLSIPRYPAFDFSEQEDVQSLPQSPSESLKDDGAKDKALQSVQYDVETAGNGDQSVKWPGILKKEESLKYDGAKDKAVQKVQDDVEATGNGEQTLKWSGINKKELATARETAKSKTLMPELMENSETESAKGSFECDAPPVVDPPSTTELALPNTTTSSLPAFTDSLMTMPFEDKHLETAVASLALRFKTDSETLQTREARQKLKRDLAEENIENEIEIMKGLLKNLKTQATTEKTRDMILNLQKHIDVVQKVATSVSRESESFGAVQQEVRTSGIIKMLLQYVNHLKQVCDSERNKLEKTRRLLTDRPERLNGAPEEHKKSLKTLGITVQSIKSFRKPIVQISES